MSSLTATSVTISWTQPVGGLTVDIYRVTLTRTSTGMCPGDSHTREKNTTSTSIVIDGLEENSIYTVTVSAMNNVFNAVRSTSGLTISTLEAGMFTCMVVRVYHINLLYCYVISHFQLNFFFFWGGGGC